MVFVLILSGPEKLRVNNFGCALVHSHSHHNQLRQLAAFSPPKNLALQSMSLLTGVCNQNNNSKFVHSVRVYVRRRSQNIIAILPENRRNWRPKACSSVSQNVSGIGSHGNPTINRLRRSSPTISYQVHCLFTNCTSTVPEPNRNTK